MNLTSNLASNFTTNPASNFTTNHSEQAVAIAFFQVSFLLACHAFSVYWLGLLVIAVGSLIFGAISFSWSLGRWLSHVAFGWLSRCPSKASNCFVMLWIRVKALYEIYAVLVEIGIADLYKSDVPPDLLHRVKPRSIDDTNDRKFAQVALTQIRSAKHMLKEDIKQIDALLWLDSESYELANFGLSNALFNFRQLERLIVMINAQLVLGSSKS